MASRKEQDSAKWMRPPGKDSLSSDRFIKPTLEARRAYEESRFTPNEEAQEAPKRVPAVVIQQLGSESLKAAAQEASGSPLQPIQAQMSAAVGGAAMAGRVQNAPAAMNAAQDASAYGTPYRQGVNNPEARANQGNAESNAVHSVRERAQQAVRAVRESAQSSTVNVSGASVESVPPRKRRSRISERAANQAEQISAPKANEAATDIPHISPIPDAQSSAQSQAGNQPLGSALPNAQIPQSTQTQPIPHIPQISPIPDAHSSAQSQAGNQPLGSALPNAQIPQSTQAQPIPHIPQVSPIPDAQSSAQSQAGNKPLGSALCAAFEEEDELDAVPSDQMAQPAPVMFGDVHSPQKSKKRAVILGVLIAAILLAAALALLQTGVLSKLTGVELPKLPPLIPAAVQQTPPGISGITEVKPVDSVSVTNFNADKTSAKAPAVINFSVYTDASVTDIKLLNDGNSHYSIDSIIGIPDKAGKLWEFSINFSAPFSGELRVYVRDNEGVWRSTNASMMLTVR